MNDIDTRTMEMTQFTIHYLIVIQSRFKGTEQNVECSGQYVKGLFVFDIAKQYYDNRK